MLRVRAKVPNASLVESILAMRLALFMLAISAIGGCGTTLKIATPGTDGYYQTQTDLPPGAILVAEPVELQEYKSMFYAKGNLDEVAQYMDFYRASIENIRFFDQVLVQKDMEQLILDRGLADEVTSVSDLIGLYHARKHLGKFLVGELQTTHKGGYTFEADFRVYDPADGESLFHVRHIAFNWDGLDQPLFLPIFNAFIDWLGQSDGNYNFVAVRPELEPASVEVGDGESADRLDVDVSGRYISEITSNDLWSIAPKYRRVELTLEQRGDWIVVTRSNLPLEITAKREGNTINFELGKNDGTGCYCSWVQGNWEITPVGKNLLGTWKRDGGRSGKWNLIRVE